jgi:hypothetical protein
VEGKFTVVVICVIAVVSRHCFGGLIVVVGFMVYCKGVLSYSVSLVINYCEWYNVS